MKRRILVADDEPYMGRVVARALEDRYEVITASDGAQAVRAAHESRPDLILLDVEMPVKDGLAALAELRAGPATSLVPVIMLSGRGTLADRVGGLELGADDYIAKPFAFAELQARVESALRRHARDTAASPVTGLPGGPAIEEHVTMLMRERIPFAFLYADINGFKSYNDVYGFAAGDRVIRMTARVLQAALGAEAGAASFLGHVGGDDFVLVTTPGLAPHAAQSAVTAFDAEAPGFYSPSHQLLGYVETRDRLGQPGRFPLVSLSIGVVTSGTRRLDHYAKVVEIASEMKAYCKLDRARRLSRFAFDRRTDQ